MEDTVLFSVIIPVYKIEEYVRECVESVLKQDFRNYEIILVDDGSPDGCPEICDELSEYDSRVRVLHKKNEGVSAARRDGVGMANGKYIICIDGDDWIREGSFSAIENIINETKTDMVCFGMVHETKKGFVPHEIPYRKGLYDESDIQKEIYPILIQSARVEYFPPSVCGKVIKKELLEKYMLVDRIATIGEDGATIIPCVYHARAMYVMEECLYFYRYNKQSVTKSHKVFNWECPKILARHISEKINLGYMDFEEQMYRKVVHDFFITAVSQFYGEQSYSLIKKEILCQMDDVVYKNAIKHAKFENSLKAQIMMIVIKKKIIFMIYLYSKLRNY